MISLIRNYREYRQSKKDFKAWKEAQRKAAWDKAIADAVIDFCKIASTTHLCSLERAIIYGMEHKEEIMRKANQL